jgi:hypothetical protein
MSDAKVGEKVYLSRPGGSHDEQAPEMGHIVHVNKDGTVNVAGYTKMGEHFSMLNVPWITDDSKPAGNYAYAPTADGKVKPAAKPMAIPKAKEEPKSAEAKDPAKPLFIPQPAAPISQ